MDETGDVAGTRRMERAPACRGQRAGPAARQPGRSWSAPSLQAGGRVLHDGRVPVLAEMQRLRAVGVASYQRRFTLADVAAEGAYWDPVAVKARRSAEADAQAAQRKAQEKKTAAAMAEPPDFQAMYPKMHASLADGETNGEPKAKAKPFEMRPLSHGGSTRVTV